MLPWSPSHACPLRFEGWWTLGGPCPVIPSLSRSKSAQCAKDVGAVPHSATLLALFSIAMWSRMSHCGVSLTGPARLTGPPTQQTPKHPTWLGDGITDVCHERIRGTLQGLYVRVLVPTCRPARLNRLHIQQPGRGHKTFELSIDSSEIS